MKRIQTIDIPGIVFFGIALVTCLLTYQDFGMAWDEPLQRNLGILNYNYIFNGSKELLSYPDKFYGAGYELLLIFIEKALHISDVRDVFLMRHIAGNIFFLIGVFSFYVLIAKLYKNKFVALLGAVMLITSPRIYAHSFFNSKDVPFLAMGIVVLAACRWAFEHDKHAFYFILGLVCGYTTGIRVMGVMYVGLISVLFLADMVASSDRQMLMRKIFSFSLFIIGCCMALYISWPYLWENPVHNFIVSYQAMSHHSWAGLVFFEGHEIKGAEVPWNYFPEWFLISNPLVWLTIIFSGIIILVINFCKRPSFFLKSKTERNFILYLLCFIVPVIIITITHATIYDDWRHLYFIYPPFILAGIYGVDKMLKSKFRYVLLSAFIIQLGFLGYFAVKNHPFEEVYFNETVSHAPEYLRRNYDLDYWGCSVKQALDHIAATDSKKLIKIAWAMNPVPNNISMLPQDVRTRFDMVEFGADYLITNFRLHPDNFPLPEVFSIKVLNSTIVCVYKMH